MVQAKMRTTDGICIDENDNIYVADFSNNAVCQVDPQGRITALNLEPGDGFVAVPSGSPELLDFMQKLGMENSSLQQSDMRGSFTIPVERIHRRSHRFCSVLSQAPTLQAYQ